MILSISLILTRRRKTLEKKLTNSGGRMTVLTVDLKRQESLSVQRKTRRQVCG